jgi:hypothetical protein
MEIACKKEKSMCMKADPTNEEGKGGRMGA